MCGRFKRKSDKKKIAKAFEVGLEEAEFGPGDDLRPHSMQPVIFTNEAGNDRLR